MKIIIAGAGEVGFHVARMLSNEDHDIVLIDKDPERLGHAESHIDVSVLRGDALSISLLETAGVDEADLFIAATSSEETNITTSIIAKNLGVKRTITRLSNPEFKSRSDKLDLAKIGIDSMVMPESLAAKELKQLIENPALTEAFEFGDGKVVMTGIVIEKDAQLVGKNLIEAAQINPKMDFTAVAIQRNGKTLIPRGDTTFKADDHAYFIVHHECLESLTKLAGKEEVEIKNIMVLGGGLIGKQFAKHVQDEYKLTLIEGNKEKCFDLADELHQTMVVHGDGSNVEFLEETGIEEMDAFVAVTGNSETNIISCLVAKNHGVKRTIALVENIDYISLSQDIGIDTLINKKMITINNIFRHVRQGDVEALTSLHGVQSELLEFHVRNTCKILNTPIKKLSFPREAIIAAVIRNGDSFIANGNTEIEEGDRVVVFTMPKAVHKVEAFFK
ncbi:Trk system potassium transporter TrkA [Pontibacter sp. G13]|uniref:Trk system potassium transporter TrkA n=1 Tax=Pontibacter sp. G13 TaxID=3074898 RepID=UPI0028894D4C|nr:Trk system potassium transporter TrkA [Pontibacter sp. G13]WNJ19260.1 Trk system potassium transporter TrkA [Pontibacter sp. G13]